VDERGTEQAAPARTDDRLAVTNRRDDSLDDEASVAIVDDGTRQPADEPSRFRSVVGTAALVLAWSFVALLAGIAISVWGGLTKVAILTALLQGLVPILFVPVWILGIVALVTKHRILAAACAVLAVAHVALVLPALGTNSLPAWAATAPKIKILSANVFDRNATPDSAAARLLESDADVLALVEVSVAVHDALVRHGVDQLFPYQIRDRASPTGDTDGIYSRIPFTDGHSVRLLENQGPAVTVRIDGRPLEIVAVHIDGAQHESWKWRGQLAALRPVIRSATGPLVISGDFNATRWNPPFADLLDLGLTDAHEDRGKGLSRSWPLTGTKLAHFGPLLRLDHALVNRTAAVRSVRDIRIPGSDHLAFEVQIAIGTGR
jgi:endonuclease/exonuclease/phosphatase (EEP) superfamily protein YafD